MKNYFTVSELCRSDVARKNGISNYRNKRNAQFRKNYNSSNEYHS